MKDYSKIIRNKARFYGIPSKALIPMLILLSFVYTIGEIFDTNTILVLALFLFLSTVIIQTYQIKLIKSEISISLLTKTLGELPIRLQIDIENLSDQKLDKLINNIIKIKSLEQLNKFLISLKS